MPATVTQLHPKHARAVDTLGASLAFELRQLARKIDRAQLKEWQLRRIASALAPELGVVAQVEERQS